MSGNTCERRKGLPTHPVLTQVISDLLKPERTNLVIREDRKRGVFVDGLSEWVVRTPQEVCPSLGQPSSNVFAKVASSMGM